MASERKRRANRRRRARVAAARVRRQDALGLEYLHMETPVDPVQDGRARCPYCGRTEKVRKNGTLGKHTGLDKKTDCEGTGQRP